MRVRPCMPSAGLSPSSLAPPLRSRIMPCKVNGGKCEEERLPRHASYAYAAEKKGKEFADVTGACGARRNAKGGGKDNAENCPKHRLTQVNFMAFALYVGESYPAAIGK